LFLKIARRHHLWLMLPLGGRQVLVPRHDRHHHRSGAEIVSAGASTTAFGRRSGIRTAVNLPTVGSEA